MTITDSYSIFTKKYYQYQNITLPDKDSTIYIVRISHQNAFIDYEIMKNSSKKLWDKDSKNRINVGDWLGFIVGKENDIRIEIYFVESELDVSKRPNHWEKNKYTDQVSTSLNIFREVIQLKNQIILSYSWSEWKYHCNYKEKYMPRGTTKSKNPFHSLSYFNDSTAKRSSFYTESPNISNSSIKLESVLYPS